MEEKTTRSDVTVALKRVRDVLVADFGPENHPDINIQRVTGYLHEIGVTPVPIAILSPTQVSEFYMLLKRGGFGYSPDNFSGLNAQFFPELGMVAIYRNLDNETINGGPIVTEGYIVHEQCHADEGLSSKVPLTNFIDKEGQPIFKKLRSGFSVGSHNAKWAGFFLEEGYADVFRGYYMARYAPESYWQNLAKALGVSHLTPNSLLTLTNARGDKVQISAKYATLERDKQGKMKLPYNESCLPAAALELLVKHDGELSQMLVDARYDIGSYRRLIQRINSHDKLYSKIFQLGHNHDDFFTGLKLVTDHILKTDESKQP